MPDRFPLHLDPLGETLEAEAGVELQDLLFPHGVEFPCGGAGVCRGCRVRVLAGSVAVTPEMEEAFSPAELADGWRLACCARVEGPLRLEIAQWETPILADYTAFRIEPADGLGIAIDLGTTTLVAQLLDLKTGEVLGVETALNPQTVHGADVMSRIQFALARPRELTRLIRTELGDMVVRLIRARGAEVRHIVAVGNTVMHHLFCGLDVEPLSHVPFRPQHLGEQVFDAPALGWRVEAPVRFLPPIGSFVGSDVLAGIVAVGMAEGDALVALVDLGTNGEIVVGNRQRMLCASTAAGPAFEAGRIRMGMRAAPGAISHVEARDGALKCGTLGGAPPRGICGSGLVSAVAAGLEAGLILPSGRLADGELSLAPLVSLTQSDIRELQLAKAAIAAGLRILATQWGATLGDLTTLYLAGAFGNYIDLASARRIGLLEVDPELVTPVGNSALRGAKMVLLSPARHASLDALRHGIQHVPLASDARFQETFVACMGL